jgi:LCP family protein required for cell wall assembly
LLLLLLLVVAWAVAGYLSFRGGVAKANARLDGSVRSALAKGNGLPLSHATNILLLGRDYENTDRRVGLNHSDSIMILRTDPSRHRLVYLSIPRDLRVPIPGHGEQKINAAMQLGGPALVIQTIEGLTGSALRVNHVMIVDFAHFKDLIDNIGGIDINVPAPILSNPFDCPYNAARCSTWKGWRFAKGPQHMNGRRALIYSRIRENQLDPRDTDISRGERQQAVVRAALHKLLGFSTFLKLPFNGKNLVRPMATDLSAWELVQLGWVLKRAGEDDALHCRLGGTAADGDIIGDEENIAVIGMVTGASAPQPPRPGGGLFAPGCVVGTRSLTR